MPERLYYLSNDYVYLSEFDIENSTFGFVWKYMKYAHTGQNRKGYDRNGKIQPYYTHLLRVLELVLNSMHKTIFEVGEKEISLCCAALCHDSFEDTTITQNQMVIDLSPVYGAKNADVASKIVKELTNPAEGFGSSDMTKEESDIIKKEWQTKHAKHISIPAKLIKMADQISNVIDIVEYTIPLWDGTDQKSRYVKKAYSVCNACMENIETASPEMKHALEHMNEIAVKANKYAMLKLNNSVNMKHFFINEK